MPTYYKIIRGDGTGGYTDFKWPLPVGENPGQWVRVGGALKLCHNGLHVTTLDKLFHWLFAWDQRVFLVETRGEVVEDPWGFKAACREIRLLSDETTPVLTEMAKLKHPESRIKAARDPRCPQDVLKALLEDTDYYVSLAARHNTARKVEE
jgi:hypothetical protein